MSSNKDYRIDSYSFQELAENNFEKGNKVIAIVKELVDQLREETVPPGIDYLRDYVSYKELITYDYNGGSNFGHIFLAYQTDPPEESYVGFMLVFDDYDIGKAVSRKSRHTKPSNFPIYHCSHFLDHDLPFLKDLYHLKNFAYIFQMGVLPPHQKQELGKKLLDAFEDFYRPHSLILGASIHEGQSRIIKILRARMNLQQDREYLFLDHYFASNSEEHWFRVVQIIDYRLFFSRINPETLPETYNTIIPIQLNQAVKNVNAIIQKLNAKIVWSSFFNANDLLRGRYGMGKDNHGFFDALTVDNDEQYNKVLDFLKPITNYLKKKDSLNAEVVSLTSSFRKKSYEVFIFNEDKDIHKMTSFNYPVTFELNKHDSFTLDLLRNEIIQKRKDFRLLTKEEKECWRKDFIQYLEQKFLHKDYPKAEKRWNSWRKQLLLTPKEEDLISWGIRNLFASKFGITRSITEKERIAYKKLIDEINNGRRVVSEERFRQWDEFVQLHSRLYDIDCTVLDPPSDYWWCHAIVPINYSEGENMVGIMFTFTCKKLRPDANGYHQIMDQLANLITSALSKNMLNILIKLQQHATYEAANRYTIAAITTRNLAHNYSSHILPHLDKPELIERLLYEDMMDSFPREMANFLSYLRTRMNLLADISTSEPVSTVTRWFRREIIDKFNEQRIIRNFLSGTAIKRLHVNYRYNGQTGQKDIAVQIPNGDLGASALFIILENIIRNSAKYEDTQGLSQLDLSVDVVAEDERGFYIRIYDHIPREEGQLEALVERINKQYIRKKTIDLRNDIRRSGWGIMEMKAAAGYLRKKVPGIVIGQDELRSIDLIKVVAHPLPVSDKGSAAKPGNGAPGRTLAYEIYLKRPRNVLFIDFQGHLSILNEQNLQKTGIRIINANNAHLDPKRVHSHTFAVYFDKEVRNNLETHKRFPLRWILIEDQKKVKELQKLLTSFDNDTLMVWLWQSWLQQYCQRKSLNFSKLHTGILNADGVDLVPVDLSLPSRRLLIFDAHGKNRKLGKIKNFEQIGFYEAYGSVDPTGIILNNEVNLTELQKKCLHLEFFEAAITQIVVIDERIQKTALTLEENKGDDFFSTLSHMRIHLPDPRVSGSPDLYATNQLELVKEWLAARLKNDKVDFIVLHLGILEAWLGSDMRTIWRWIECNIRAIDDRPEIVLISGRGKPHQFPAEISYLAYNNVARYITGGTPSKYHLSRILFSARTRMGI